MKAVKRERYGAKENDRLIKMLTAVGEYPQVQGEEIKTENMDDVTEISTNTTELPPLRKVRPFKVRGDGRKSRKDIAEEEAQTIDDEMAVDKPEHIFSQRSMRDQFGNYPAWMNKRKVRTQQKKNKRIAKRRAVSVAGGKRKMKR